jgi:hypothetical protein
MPGSPPARPNAAPGCSTCGRPSTNSRLRTHWRPALTRTPGTVPRQAICFGPPDHGITHFCQGAAAGPAGAASPDPVQDPSEMAARSDRSDRRRGRITARVKDAGAGLRVPRGAPDEVSRAMIGLVFAGEIAGRAGAFTLGMWHWGAPDTPRNPDPPHQASLHATTVVPVAPLDSAVSPRDRLPGRIGAYRRFWGRGGHFRTWHVARGPSDPHSARTGSLRRPGGTDPSGQLS